MTSGSIALVVLTLVSYWALISLMERVRLRRVRLAFAKTRQPLSDDQFLIRAGATDNETAFFFAARAAIAEACGVHSSMLHPEDPIQALLILQYDGGDYLDIVFRIERKYGHKLRRCDFPTNPSLSDVMKCLYAARPTPDRP